MQLPERLKKLSKQQTLLAAGALLLAMALTIGLLVIRSDKPIADQAQVITYSTDTPDENPPGKDFRWRGGDNDPKYITLPTINAAGYVQNVGVDQKRAVAVPNNIHMAGWFVDMARPGEQGLSIIDGHVNGRRNDGIFKNLVKLKKGDQFTVTFGDDRVIKFAVDEVVTKKTEESASVLFSQKPGILKQLNLITCGGDFDKSTQQYKERIIAIASVVE